jgi:hypothetical protein
MPTLTQKQKLELDAKTDGEVEDVASLDSHWDLAKLMSGDIFAVPRYDNTDSPSDFAPYKTNQKQWDWATRSR